MGQGFRVDGLRVYGPVVGFQGLGLGIGAEVEGFRV